MTAGVFRTLAAAWRPLLTPWPGAWDYWPLTLIPLCLAVAIVYKTTKCRHVEQIPSEAGVTFAWVFGGLVTAAGVLWGGLWLWGVV